MSTSRLKYWSPELIRCFDVANDLFPLCFLDTPIREMPEAILQLSSDDSYSQWDRIRLKTVAVRIAALLKGGEA